MKTFTKKDGWWKLREILAVQEDFTNSPGTFTGRSWNEAGMPPIGRMDEAERLILRADIDNFGLLYMVASYATPVAWLRSDGFWRVTGRNYSKTTKQHLIKLRTAVESLRETQN